MEHALPDLQALRIGFIGAGRLGTALAWSLARNGCRVEAVASRSDASARRLADGIRGCRVARAQEVAEDCDLVFVTTPDDAIGTMASQLTWRAGTGVVHCSGVTEVDALSKAAAAGAWIGGFHPMQGFTEPEVSIRSLPGCTITIEAGEPLDARLVELALRLECRVNRLPPGARARYHAAALYAGQFLNALLREGSTIWQSWGASEEDAVAALLPLARGILGSIEKAGLARGMPGPVARGDLRSIAKHVGALRALDPAVLDLYRLLCLRSIPLALEQGGIDAATAARIRQVLDGGPDSARADAGDTDEGG
jgi:predicted short-subunit dehydrogenase-like oxidoreductase (DUF2520 family)